MGAVSHGRGMWVCVIARPSNPKIPPGSTMFTLWNTIK